jgi:hypothetical protein
MTAGDAAPPYVDAPRDLVLGHTPEARCGPGSLPETSWQGRVPAADVVSGRAAKGYRCNAAPVSHFGTSGGYRVARYRFDTMIGVRRFWSDDASRRVACDLIV